MKFAAVAFSLMAATVSASPFAGKSANNAKAAFTNKLVRGASETANSQLRKLNDEYLPDISGYSVKFQQCQFVKAYDDELAENEEAGTVLGVQRFVIFRLCPDSCDSCSYGYGEYVISLEEYLESATAYQQEQDEEYCQACDECGNNDYNENQNYAVEVDCSTCYDTCQMMENMEDNGYIDAIDFLECQMIYDPEDDRSEALYAGPICSNGGSKIKIGVFTDEECNLLKENADVNDYLQNDNGGYYQISYALLKKTYGEESCVSCLVVDYDNDNNNNNNGDYEEPEVVEMCENLYELAGKCEKTHGFDDGYTNYYGYENQLATESLVCDFISSLEAGTYDESGNIRVSGSSSSSASGESTTTGGQKFALAFFILGTVLLAVYAAMLHSKLTKGAKADLSRQGGAMA